MLLLAVRLPPMMAIVVAPETVFPFPDPEAGIAGQRDVAAGLGPLSGPAVTRR